MTDQQTDIDTPRAMTLALLENSENIVKAQDKTL